MAEPMKAMQDGMAMMKGMGGMGDPKRMPADMAWRHNMMMQHVEMMQMMQMMQMMMNMMMQRMPPAAAQQ